MGAFRMKIKIAAFGNEDVMKRIMKLADTKSDIELMPFTYSKAEDVTELIEKAYVCDIYLFTEQLSYLYAKDLLVKKRIPSIQIPYDEYMIIHSLFRLNHLHKQVINRISLDVLSGKHVSNVLADIAMKNKDIYIFQPNKQQQVHSDDIVSFHQTLWKEGKIDTVLTSTKEIEIKLRHEGIPVSCMTIPRLNIACALEEARKIVTLSEPNTTQIVSGYVRLKQWEVIEQRRGSTVAKQSLQKLHRLLLTFAKQTNASVFPSDDNRFILFGTKGVIDHIQNHYRDFPLLYDIEKTLQTPVDIGFGLALTAKEAVENAKLALDACSTEKDSKCYIVNERQDTIGPIGIIKHFDTSKLYQALIHKARLNNELSYNFIDFIQSRNNEPFSSHDIASHYKVTKRSAERTINKLLAGEVIKVAGEEKPYLKGRPRKLFRLNQ